MQPLVTVVCICYNQAKFVVEALQSVRRQTYPNIQLIVVDDASTDSSAGVIRTCLTKFPNATFLPLQTNGGNCKAFNLALKHVEGEYVIDLAADDVLLPNRVAAGVDALSTAGDAYAVNFTDAVVIDEDGRELYLHSDRFPHHQVPQGDIYGELIKRYFILSPTMMMRTRVVKELGGYDENLAYEDFDFMIRSSRNYKYNYTADALVRKRLVKGSMSQKQFRLFSPQLRSTYRVCEKIMYLNRTETERRALTARLLYELRVCLRFNIPLAIRYWWLWRRNRRKRY